MIHFFFFALFLTTNKLYNYIEKFNECIHLMEFINLKLRYIE